MDVLYLLFNAFSNLPPWMRYVFIALSLASVLGLSMYFTPMVGLIAAGGIILALLLIALFQVILRKRREKKAAAFGGEMQSKNASAPAELNDPARRARLEDLRRNFENGVQKFREAGKNLYNIPWYAIVGEPGAGKTEAIRHSNVGFPPGMQDEFQGVGGTINMNWWFTNDAVILDTAGRLIFEEVPTGATSEWREFLGMLKVHRPNCPINGLLLVIPVDSLIKDSGEEIVRKAGRIASQLEVIQRQLDIRFPVYVVISKCDLLNGFREFFDDLSEAAAQYQMTGWSNPDPLDQPFRPELVDEHIQMVAQRLTRRRLGLLLDPVARSGERRVDEVDRLFALPHSLAMVGPNLQRYLQTLFLPGEWSSKPLFLRGIYFTSSMREGSALDQELAQALNLSVDDLPDVRPWERERSYFLRDVFTEKAFRERGLVTRATDTRKLMMRRRMTLFGAGVAGLLVLLLFSIFGFRSLRESIGNQSGYWARAADGWQGNAWQPIVKPASAPLQYEYTGQQPVGPGTTAASKRLFRRAEESLADFQGSLRKLAETPLHIPWWFRLVSNFGVNIDSDRRRAERIVFEDSIVAPAVAASRDRMAGLPVEARLPEQDARAEAGALVSLLRLEVGLIQRKEKRPETANLSGDSVLNPLTVYTAGAKCDPPLIETLDWMRTAGDGKGNWPGDWISGGHTLAANKPIHNGLERFIASARATLEEEGKFYPLLAALTEEVRNFGKNEDGLYAAARLNLSPDKVDQEVGAAFTKLRDQRQTLELKLAEARQAGLFGTGPESLAAAYERLLEAGRFKLQTALTIERDAQSVLDATVLSNVVGQVTGEKYPLPREIRDKIKPILAELQAKFDGTLLQVNLNELKQLDSLYLLDAGGGKPHYLTRWNFYDQSMTSFPPLAYSSTIDLIGQGWKPLAAVLDKANAIRASVAAYQGAVGDKPKVISDYCLARATELQTREFAKNYLAQAQKQLLERLRFPFIFDWTREPLSPEQAVVAGDLIAKLVSDLSEATLATVADPYRAPLLAFRERIAPLEMIRKAIFSDNRNMRMAQVILLPRNTQFELSGQRVGMDAFRGIQLRAGTIRHGDIVKFGKPGQTQTDSNTEVDLGRFTLYEPFHFHFHKILNDPKIDSDMPAPDAWTALKLLWERNAIRLPDGKHWRIGLVPGEGKLIWLELRFEEPLPALEGGPTLQSLGLAPR